MFFVLSSTTNHSLSYRFILSILYYIHITESFYIYQILQRFSYLSTEESHKSTLPHIENKRRRFYEPLRSSILKRKYPYSAFSSSHPSSASGRVRSKKHRFHPTSSANSPNSLSLLPPKYQRSPKLFGTVPISFPS